METLIAEPLYLIVPAVALVALVLMARGRSPRRIGLGTPRGTQGAVSRGRRAQERTPAPTQQSHETHSANWRTSSPVALSKPRPATPAKAAAASAPAATMRDRRTSAPVESARMRQETQAQAAAKAKAWPGSLQARLEELQKTAQATGRKPTPEQAFSALVGSTDVNRAVSGISRMISLAIWAWLALWGFAAAMIILTIMTGEADEEAMVALPIVLVPLFLGLVGKRAMRRFHKRAEASMGGRRR